MKPDAEVVGTTRTLADIAGTHDMIDEKDGVFYAKHMVRLCVFIPGKLLETKNMKDEEAYDYGVAAAVLDASIQKESPPDVDVQETFIWNSANILKYGFREKYVKSLKDPDRKTLVEGILEKFSGEIPQLLTTPKQWVHGDLNDQNILFADNDAQKTGMNKLVGIIDFDDLLDTHRVVNLANALMYTTNIISAPAMLDKSLSLAQHLYRGYTTRIVLSDAEVDCVYSLMLVRYVLSCCVATYQYEYVDPGNEYLMISAKIGWQSMKELVGLGKEKFMENLLGT